MLESEQGLQFYLESSPSQPVFQAELLVKNKTSCHSQEELPWTEFCPYPNPYVEALAPTVKRAGDGTSGRELGLGKVMMVACSLSFGISLLCEDAVRR